MLLLLLLLLLLMLLLMPLKEARAAVRSTYASTAMLSHKRSRRSTARITWRRCG